MDIVLYVFRQFVIVLIDVLHLAMFVRAIWSWINPTQEGRFIAFLYALTEPVILPVRALFAKMHWFEGVPMDVPFSVTWLLLLLIQLLLSVA